MLANYQNWNQQYQDATYLTEIALKMCDFDSVPFRTSVGTLVVGDFCMKGLFPIGGGVSLF